MPKQILSKAKIIDASIELIRHDQPLTFSDLARKLGTRPQALYLYYPNVAALKRAIAKDAETKVVAQIKEQVGVLTGKDAVKQIISASCELGLKKPRLSAFIVTMVQEDKNTPTEYETLLDQYLAVSYKQEKVRVLAKRSLMNVVVGELVNVGTDRFHLTIIDRKQGLKWMVDTLMAKLDELDEETPVKE
ncbi:TetR/AcrR family transcriptional regulator [Lactobacillus corticis]|uniref:TetR family transcriptional regulator n=1 Tax=Lactobacillus corticis TaxID=2201249 RepID=A0A916VGT6_9LACO|nr:TetR/AcrR family transcriptional regulator [Lactobacillus corticis]GFZ26311.1 hypothetical protein LCB40_01910 [Lactobacillus corticis]